MPPAERRVLTQCRVFPISTSNFHDMQVFHEVSSFPALFQLDIESSFAAYSAVTQIFDIILNYLNKLEIFLHMSSR